MTISEALADIFDQLYDSRLELVEVLEKKGIQYPSDLTRIDEWGTVRIVGQYLGMELDEYTVEQVEHLKRKKGRLLTGGNVTSIRDSLQVARQMVPSTTNYFDKNRNRKKSEVFDFPENMKLYWAIVKLSNTVTFSIGVGVIANKDIVYSMTAGLSWNYYDLELPFTDVISIQPVYSYYLQMMVFLIRTENHIYLYGATFDEYGLRKANNLDKYGFLEKYKVYPLANSSTLKMINIRNEGEENFLIFMNASIDGDEIPRLRIVHMATGSLQNTIANDRRDPVLANGFNFTEKEFPITPYGNHFFVVTRNADFHMDDKEKWDPSKYGYLLFNRESTLWLYKVTVTEERELEFSFVKEIATSFINTDENWFGGIALLTDEIERGNLVFAPPGYEGAYSDDDIIMCKLTNGKTAFIYDTDQFVKGKNAMIDTVGIVYQNEGKLYAYTNTDTLVLSDVQDDKMYPCYTNENYASAFVYQGLDGQYTLHGLAVGNEWNSQVIFKHTEMNNPFCCNLPAYTKVVKGANGVQMMLRSYIYKAPSNLFDDVKNRNNLFISYDHGESWNVDLKPSRVGMLEFIIVGLWYFHNTWFVCNSDGDIRYCENKEAGRWKNGCKITTTDSDFSTYFSNETKNITLDLVRNGLVLTLQAFSHPDEFSSLKEPCSVSITWTDLKDETKTITLEYTSTEIINPVAYEKEPDMPIRNPYYYVCGDKPTPGGNAHSIIDPIDGIEKKYEKRIFQHGSRIEVNSFEIVYDNTILSGAHICNLGGVPYLRSGDTLYSLEDSQSFTAPTNYCTNSKAYNALGYMSYIGNTLVLSTANGNVLSRQSPISGVPIKIRDINGYFAVLSGTNVFKFIDWSDSDTTHTFPSEYPNETNNIVDCVYYNEMIWYLIRIEAEGQNRLYLYPVSMKNSFLGLWDQMKYDRHVLPNADEMVCVGAVDSELIPTIQRGYNYLVIVSDALYTYDGWHLHKCVLPDSVDLTDITDIDYQEPTVYFYAGNRLIGYMNDYTTFHIYPHYDASEISRAVGGNIYTCAKDANGNIAVYVDGLNDPFIRSGVYGANGDSVLIQKNCTPFDSVSIPLPNIHAAISMRLHMFGEKTLICLDTPSCTVNVTHDVNSTEDGNNFEGDEYKLRFNPGNTGTIKDEAFYLLGTTL